MAELDKSVVRIIKFKTEEEAATAVARCNLARDHLAKTTSELGHAVGKYLQALAALDEARGVPGRTFGEALTGMFHNIWNSYGDALQRREGQEWAEGEG